MDNKGMKARQGPVVSPPGRLGSGNRKRRFFRRSTGLGGRHLGNLDLDPKLDLGQDPVEAGIPRAVLEMSGHRLELLEGPLGQVTADQPDLELVESLERQPPPLDRMAAALSRVLDTLQCNK